MTNRSLESILLLSPLIRVIDMISPKVSYSYFYTLIEGIRVYPSTIGNYIPNKRRPIMKKDLLSNSKVRLYRRITVTSIDVRSFIPVYNVEMARKFKN